MSKASYAITQCQICNSDDLQSVLFLGYFPPVNLMPAIDAPIKEESVFPLELYQCSHCSLVQIGFNVDPNLLFPKEYPYLSGSTKILKRNFDDLAEESIARLHLNKDDLVVDIGSNDGTLLQGFLNRGCQVLGIEPTDAYKVAVRNGIASENRFFNLETAKYTKEKYGNASVITAANVFAHIPDVNSIVSGIDQLLAPQGVFISESHYLMGLIETLQYDTIYHEHLRYYSLHSLQFLLQQHDFEIFHVKRIPTHGGSIRVYSARKGQHSIEDSVYQLLSEEENAGIVNGSALKAFCQGVLQSKLDLYKLLAPIKAEGASIYGIGAPSRSSTFLSYVGIDNGLLECIMEIPSSPKVNRYAPGTRIPVLDEQKLFEDQPEYALLLSWHIADELIANLRKKGYKGKFIVPLPEPTIVD